MRAVTVGHIGKVLYNAKYRGIDGSIILDRSEMGGCVCCIRLSEDREQWWAALNDVMKF